MEPLGIMYLSSFLKKHGHECDFIDIAFEKNIERKIKKISADIIGYSVTTGMHRFYQQLNQELKKKLRFFAFFGGPHCSFFPEYIYEEDIDAICRGEGEYPFLELTNCLERGKDITRIKNLWIKVDGVVYKNEMSNLIQNLDELPFPDRELINKYNHYRKMHRRSIMTGRGCPYDCTYCFNHSYKELYHGKGQIIRRRSVDNVIEELRFIKRTYRPFRFHFWDDTFNLNHKWLLEFCNTYKKVIGLPFLANVRMDLIKEEIVKALKDAGCITVNTAVESGNEHIRNNILKRGISEEQILYACSLFHRYGIKIYIGNMIGLPDETLDTAFETLALNIKCEPAYSHVCIYAPYPKTWLSEYSRKRGYYTDDVDSINESYYDTSSLRMKDIKKMVRLHHLFAWGVAFPFLIPLIKILIRIPLNRFYLFLWHLRRAWAYFFKVKYIDLSELFIRE